METPSADETTTKLIARLRAVRAANGGLPDVALKERLSADLKEALVGMPSDKADRATALVRTALIQEAETRQARIQRLENEVAELQRDRDRLAAELGSLPMRGAEPMPPGKDVGVKRIRQALLLLADGRALTQETVSLSAEDLQLLQLVEILYQFALRFTTGTQEFILKVGHDIEGSILEAFDREIKETFRGCARGQEGSLKGLEDILAKGVRFLKAVGDSYEMSIHSGVREILKATDPQAAADRNRRKLTGVDYEAAWKELSTAHGDIDGETDGGRWTRFFQKTLREELTRRTQAGPPKR